MGRRRFGQREEIQQRAEGPDDAITDQPTNDVRPFNAISSELPPAHGHDLSQVEVLRSDQPAPDQQERVQRATGSGSALDPVLRDPLEGVFRTDFGQVNVHTDTEADDLTRSLNARAFTTGEDIFFNR